MHSCLFSLDVFIGGSPGALCLLMLSPPYCHSLTPLMSAKVIVKTNSRDNLTHSHPINLYSEYFAFYRLYKTPTNLYSITVYHHFTPLQDYFHYDLGTEWEDNQIISHKWSDQNVLRSRCISNIFILHSEKGHPEKVHSTPPWHLNASKWHLNNP